MRLTRDDSEMAKGWAILLMLTHHLFGFGERIPHESPLHEIIFHGYNLDFVIGQGFGKICVAMFLFLSGYGLATKTVHPRELPRQMAKRLSGFYLMFWVNLLIWVPLCFWFSPDTTINAGRFTFGLKKVLDNIILSEPSFSGEWWFGRVYLLTLAIVWPLLIIILRYWSLCWPFTISALLCGLSPLLHTDYRVGEFLFWQFAFVVGFSVCRMRDVLPWPVVNSATNRGSHVILLVITLGAVFGLRRPLGFQADWLFAPVVIWLLAQLTGFISVKGRRLLDWLGRYSGHMWLNHTFFIYYLFPRWFYSFSSHIVTFVVLLAASGCSAVATKWAADRLTALTAGWFETRSPKQVPSGYTPA